MTLHKITHQNEVQGLHWKHKQVTLMPTVAHFKYSKCHQLATHEIVHISDDMKHNAHLVKVFTKKSIEVLKSNNVNICKIIEFTDQAPSQYKNKTAFNHLANTKIPVQKNYFGVRHGKSSCDACTGRVKQGITRLVKSKQEVVNSPQSFYYACVKHLQISKDDKCQHYMITFHFHKQIGKRPKTDNLVGIPGARKLHQIGNTGGNVPYFHKFACCCYGCLHGTETCQNNICPKEWTAFDLAKKKTVNADLKYWFGTEFMYWPPSHVPTEPQQRAISWDAILQALNQQKTYAQLCRYINSNAIPDLICVPNDTLTQKELNNLDLVAMHHMPNDMPANLAPLQTGTDGNCFPRTVNYLLFKTQERYTEIRVRLIYEAVKNIEHYLDDNYVSIGAHNFYSDGTLPEQYAQYSDNFNPHGYTRQK